ncbi:MULTISPECIES: recombinase family protein [Streptomyces rochei group]|uniref:recombinase family protein n=1 Tax=Streptomyces rochei group TaxID=2867164 RepID=UPI001874D172|nr:recombinase family protein [Streptomyces vinaceusdrappus]GHC44210.1 integrase [Streptomyces vinaceusdrappus]
MLPRQRNIDSDTAPQCRGDHLTTFDGLTPYIGYVRVSTWKEEKISPDLQRESILRWARDVGARIVQWVEDLDESGRHFKRKITGCVEAVEAGRARGVAVWRYSRFGRDRTGNALWLARLEKAGGQLESATERIDATTAVGRFQRGMILEFGAFESDRAGEQWRETHEHRKYKQGLPAQGRKRAGYIWHRRIVPDPNTPDGYRLQKERYEIDPEYGPVIADLYRQYGPNTGFGDLCAQLNRAGWRTTQGALWRTETLTRYMDSGFPAGLLTVHNPDCRCGKTDGTCKNHVYIQGAHEELIEWELWEAYQKRRQEVRNTAPRSRVGLYQLTGLAKCAQCRRGTSLTAQRSGGRNRPGYSYRCSLRAKAGELACEGVYIRRTLVEDAVFRWLQREAAAGIDAAPSTPTEDAHARAAREQANHARARVTAQTEIDKQRAALARLRADYNANPDDYGPGEYEDAVAEIRKKRQAAEETLAALPAEVEKLPDRAEYIPLVLSVIDAWEHMTDAEINALLRKLIRRVALIRHGAGSDGCTVEVHPVWEPDPWPPARATQAEATAR